MAVRTNFTEDNLSKDWGGGGVGFGMIQANYIQAHLLLCSQVPNRPGPVLVHGPEVGDTCPRRTGRTRIAVPVISIEK